MFRVTSLLVMPCIVFGFMPDAAKAESNSTAASLTTLIPTGAGAQMVERQRVRAALKKREKILAAREELASELENGEPLKIEFSPREKKVRFSDLFRKMSSGDRPAAAEWKKLTPKDRLPALMNVLKHSSLKLREKAMVAINDLSREDDPEGRALPSLVNAAIQDPDADIRKAALKNLLEAKDDRVPNLLIKNFKKRGPEQRQRVMGALREFGGPRVFEAVIEHWREIWGPGPRAHMFVARQQSYIADYEIAGDSYDPVVRQFLVGVVLDVKSLLVTRDYYLVDILREVTGENKGKNLEEWRKWWAAEGKNKKNGKAKKEGK